MTEPTPGQPSEPTDPRSDAAEAPDARDELDTRSELDDLDPEDRDVAAASPPDEEDPEAFDDGTEGEDYDTDELDDAGDGYDPAEDADGAESLDDDPYEETVAMEDSPEIAEQNEAREEQALTTDTLRPEDETTEYEPPYSPSTPTAEGETPADVHEGETIEERLAQEQPESEGPGGRT